MTEIIAIDGPAGSGKSSVSKALARARSFGYLDTGAVYRALAWFVLESGAETDDEQAVLAAAQRFAPIISLDPDNRAVSVDGVDITDAIRAPRVSAAVSAVARVLPVREQVNTLFRSLVSGSGLPAVVVEGRDITTVVAPDAPVRVLLTAHPDVRSARRAAELSGEDAKAVAESLHQRDASDSQVVDFLNAAVGVTVVDSSDLDFAQTIDAVSRVVDENLGSGA